MAVAIVTGALAVLCFRRPRARRFGWIFGVVAFIAGALVAPSMFKDRIIVGSRSLTVKTGFWFAQLTKGFDYEGVSFVGFKAHRNLKGEEILIWEIHYQDGNILGMELNDLWRLNAQETRAALETRGINFSN
jgi:hypothetical protein